jgi:hypothetical protein
MIVEQLVEWRLAREIEVLGENLLQRHFVHHKSHMTRPGLEPRAAAVGSQRLTAWAMARPFKLSLSNIYCNVFGTGDAVRIVTSCIYDFTSRHCNLFLQCALTLWRCVSERSWLLCSGPLICLLWSVLVSPWICCFYLPVDLLLWSVRLSVWIYPVK